MARLQSKIHEGDDNTETEDSCNCQSIQEPSDETKHKNELTQSIAEKITSISEHY